MGGDRGDMGPRAGHCRRMAVHLQGLRGCGSGVAAVVLAVSVACGNSPSLGSNSRVQGDGSESPQRPRQAAGCTRIETFKKQPARHIPIGSTYRHYDSSPPTSGPHWPIFADPGFYTVELPPEELVHNLEHGQIVVWYDPDVPSEIQTALERLVARNPGAIVAAPSDMIQPPYESCSPHGAPHSHARGRRPL